MTKRTQRIAVFLGLLALLRLPPAARAHETDHFTPPPRRPFANLGPAFTQDFHRRIARAVRKTNIQIQSARHAPSTRERLRSPDHIARMICNEFGVAGFYIDEVERFVSTPKRRTTHPGLLTHHRARPSIYDEALLPVDPRRFYLLWRGSTFMINGVYVSSDKIGHFVHHGYNYYVAYRRALHAGLPEPDAREQAAYQVGAGNHLLYSEWGLLGKLSSGVVSNADLAANYVGMLFYINLTEPVQLQGTVQPPMLRLSAGRWHLNPHVEPDSDFLTRFFSPHFDEALNPNWYDPLTAAVLRRVISERCRALRALYVDKNGLPLSDHDFIRLRRELTTYYGQPYGHTGLDEQHVVSVANACACVDPADTPPHPHQPFALKGMTALHAAARTGDTRQVHHRLAAGDNPNAVTIRGVTPLHLAANPETADLLLQAGASPAARDDLRRTPLHWATRAQHRQIAALLLEAGADPNAADCDRRTPLHVAVQHADHQLVSLLLHHGGWPQAAALYGTTPLHLAVRTSHRENTRLLIAAGAGVNVTDDFGCTPTARSHRTR